MTDFTRKHADMIAKLGYITAVQNNLNWLGAFCKIRDLGQGKA